MTPWHAATAAIAVAATVAAAGCVRVSEGTPVAQSSGGPFSVSTSPVPGVQPQPGVVTTQQAPVPAGAVTCAPDPKPPVGFVAVSDDASAPQIVVAVPEGWSFTGGADAVAGTLSGPKGMTATITITPTDLEPDAAFRAYADAVMQQSSISSVSVLPGELCEYSGQKLMGAWSNTPQNAVEFYDRVAHVWTNTGDFLVAVHVEAPAGVEELDAASDVLTGDFEVRIP